MVRIHPKPCSREMIKVAKKLGLKIQTGASLVVQWLKIHLSNAEKAGSIPSWGTKVPHVVGQLSPSTITTEAAHHS